MDSYPGQVFLKNIWQNRAKPSIIINSVIHDQFASDVERLSESLGQLPEPVAKPRLIVVSGLPGTGKFYFCKRISERLLFVTLESDALRKTLFSSPSYTAKENSRLFKAFHHLIEKLLKQGVSLIIDATNLTERHREYFYHIADSLDAKLILVRVEAPPQVVHERLKARQEEANPKYKSDADWKVYQRMKPLVQKIHRKHYAADTSHDITPVVDRIMKEATR